MSELLILDSALDLAVEVRRSRADVDVPNVECRGMPVELGLELRAVVRLHDVDAKRESPHDFLEETDRRALIAHASYTFNTRMRVQSSIAVNWYSRFPVPGFARGIHVHLEAVPGLRLLVSLPALPVRPVLLIRRQAVHPCLPRSRWTDGRATDTW